MNSTEPTQGGHIMRLLTSIPLVTFILLVINIGIFIIGLVSDAIPLRTVTISPYYVIEESEWYRLFSSPFFHLNPMHILFNMMTLFSFGQSLEPKFGSIYFFFLIFWYVVLTGLLYLGIAVLLYAMGFQGSYSGSAAGFSGVLFALAVDECNLSHEPNRSFFGLFSVPTKLYPWVLMIAISVVMYNVSFLGHLSGILCGMMHCASLFRFLIPNLRLLTKIQDSALFHPIKRMRMYCLTPPADVILTNIQEYGFFSTTFSWLGFLLLPLWHLLLWSWRSLRGLCARSRSTNTTFASSAGHVSGTSSRPSSGVPVPPIAVPGPSVADGEGYSPLFTGPNRTTQGRSYVGIPTTEDSSFEGRKPSVVDTENSSKIANINRSADSEAARIRMLQAAEARKAAASTRLTSPEREVTI